MSFRMRAEEWTSNDPESAMLDLCPAAKRKIFEKHANVCESPIERIALAALLAMTACIVVSADAPIPGRADWEIVVVPQAKVPPYRLDFAIMGKGPTIYALECDGREFHQDHDRDNTRAIALASQGVFVFRVSGSSLHRDPIAALQPLVDMARGKT